MLDTFLRRYASWPSVPRMMADASRAICWISRMPLLERRGVVRSQSWFSVRVRRVQFRAPLADELEAVVVGDARAHAPEVSCSRSDLMSG